MMRPYFGRKPNLFDSKVLLANGKTKLVKRYYKLQVIKTPNGNEVQKKYIDGDTLNIKVK